MKMQKVKTFLEDVLGWLGVFSVVAGLSLITYYIKNPS